MPRASLPSQRCATSDGLTSAYRETKSLWWVSSKHAHKGCTGFSGSAGNIPVCRVQNSQPFVWIIYKPASLTVCVLSLWLMNTILNIKKIEFSHFFHTVKIVVQFTDLCECLSPVMTCLLSTLQKRGTLFLWVSTTCPSVSASPSFSKGKETHLGVRLLLDNFLWKIY